MYLLLGVGMNPSTHMARTAGITSLTKGHCVHSHDLGSDRVVSGVTAVVLSAPGIRHTAAANALSAHPAHKAAAILP